MTIQRNEGGGNGVHAPAAAKGNSVRAHNGHGTAADPRPVLVTGGAGFIGSNLADRLARAERNVILFDNLSRAGVCGNLQWLRQTHGDRIVFVQADVRNAEALTGAVSRASAVFHFAAQVAVTTSLDNPRHDLEVNLLGTFNLLEALRACPEPPPLVFTSTNKVYGALPGVTTRRVGERYEPLDEEIRRHGISERWPLDFHSPYGCSKGAADQYVLDYARSYGLPAVVFRMSCIYGRHQMGTEDQGWVAHFLIRALQDAPITIYGDGCQVRDVLFADDLADALLLASHNARRLAGQAFNIGGGPDRTISLRELLEIIYEIHGSAPRVLQGDWRVGDQRYYVSDTRAFQEATGWRPAHSVNAGLQALYEWLRSESADAPPQYETAIPARRRATAADRKSKTCVQQPL